MDDGVLHAALESVRQHPELHAAIADLDMGEDAISEALAAVTTAALDEIETAIAEELAALTAAREELTRVEQALVAAAASSPTLVNDTIARLHKQITTFQTEQDRLMSEWKAARDGIEAFGVETEVLRARDSATARVQDNGGARPSLLRRLRGKRDRPVDTWAERDRELQTKLGHLQEIKKQVADVVTAKKRLRMRLEKIETREALTVLGSEAADAELKPVRARVDDAMGGAVAAVASALLTQHLSWARGQPQRSESEPAPTPRRTVDEPAPASPDHVADGAPTAAVLWAHSDPQWTAAEEKAWANTVLGFTGLLRAYGIDAEVDLFHGHTATDWARFGPGAIRSSDYVLVAVSESWRRAWEDGLTTTSVGALGEANTLRGTFQVNPADFLQRVILVVLPGCDESALPTELRATNHWERVPTLDVAGIENLLRRMTAQPAYPKPALGIAPVLPPRWTQLRVELDRADTALADMPPPSGGAADEPWDHARGSVQARRQALLRELERMDEHDSAGPSGGESATT